MEAARHGEGETDWSCEYCGEVFRTYEECEAHEQSQHGPERGPSHSPKRSQLTRAALWRHAARASRGERPATTEKKAKQKEKKERKPKKEKRDKKKDTRQDGGGALVVQVV